MCCLPLAVCSNFRRLDLLRVLGADGFHDLQLIILVYDSIDWETVPLLQSHRTCLNTMRSPCRTSTNGDFHWFDPVTAVSVTSEAAHECQKRGAPAASGPFYWETVPRTFDPFFNRPPDVSSPCSSPLYQSVVDVNPTDCKLMDRHILLPIAQLIVHLSHQLSLSYKLPSLKN